MYSNEYSTVKKLDNGSQAALA